MATSKQKKDLVEELKGPHFYRISLQGYGAECSYMHISKEAFDFWSNQSNSDAIHYILSAEDQTPEWVGDDEGYEDINGSDIPREAMFMHGNVGTEYENDAGSSWYEPVDEFDHTWGTTLDSEPRLNIEKLNQLESWDANVIETVVDGEGLNDWAYRMSEKHSSEGNDHESWVEDHGQGDNYPAKGSYICQMVSEEKGVFFDAVVETPGLFDDKKLKWAVSEAPNGEDMIWGAEYNGEELDNEGGDTDGKGYYVYFYKQEF